MKISGTLIAYYHLCHRKLWLHHHHFRMENATANAFVEEGQLIDQQSYSRRSQRWRQLHLGHLKIDHFDPATHTVREVKKSPKLEYAHIAQVKYYLYHLEQLGVQNASGLIEYPQQRKTTKVSLSEEDRQEIRAWEAEIERLVKQPTCPELVRKTYCRHCAFRDFCFI